MVIKGTLLFYGHLKVLTPMKLWPPYTKKECSALTDLLKKNYSKKDFYDHLKLDSRYLTSYSHFTVINIDFYLPVHVVWDFLKNT